MKSDNGQQTGPSLTSLAAFGMIVLLVYVGLYALLVEPRRPVLLWFASVQPESEVELDARYRLIGRAGDIVFRPVNELDRIIRPDTWNHVYRWTLEDDGSD